MTSVTLDRHRGHANTYDVVALGYNYRMDEIHAALAREQLKKLQRNNSRRRRAAALYRDGLRNIPQITVPFGDKNFEDNNYHIFPVLLNPDVDRQALMTHLRQHGIQTSIHYPPIHQFTFYRRNMTTGNLPLTEHIGLYELTLPMFSGIPDHHIEYVIDVLSSYLKP